MKTNCAVTCNICITESPVPAPLASAAPTLSASTAAATTINAATTASVECADENINCDLWGTAAYGYCNPTSTYSTYMASNCRKACGFCTVDTSNDDQSGQEYTMALALASLSQGEFSSATKDEIELGIKYELNLAVVSLGGTPSDVREVAVSGGRGDNPLVIDVALSAALPATTALFVEQLVKDCQLCVVLGTQLRCTHLALAEACGVPLQCQDHVDSRGQRTTTCTDEHVCKPDVSSLPSLGDNSFNFKCVPLSVDTPVPTEPEGGIDEAVAEDSGFLASVSPASLVLATVLICLLVILAILLFAQRMYPKKKGGKVKVQPKALSSWGSESEPNRVHSQPDWEEFRKQPCRAPGHPSRPNVRCGWESDESSTVFSQVQPTPMELAAKQRDWERQNRAPAPMQGWSSNPHSDMTPGSRSTTSTTSGPHVQSTPMELVAKQREWERKSRAQASAHGWVSKPHSSIIPGSRSSTSTTSSSHAQPTPLELVVKQRNWERSNRVPAPVQMRESKPHSGIIPGFRSATSTTSSSTSTAHTQKPHARHGGPPVRGPTPVFRQCIPPTIREGYLGGDVRLAGEPASMAGAARSIPKRSQLTTSVNNIRPDFGQENTDDHVYDCAQPIVHDSPSAAPTEPRSEIKMRTVRPVRRASLKFAPGHRGSVQYSRASGSDVDKGDYANSTELPVMLGLRSIACTSPSGVEDDEADESHNVESNDFLPQGSGKEIERMTRRIGTIKAASIAKWNATKASALATAGVGSTGSAGPSRLQQRTSSRRDGQLLNGNEDEDGLTEIEFDDCLDLPPDNLLSTVNESSGEDNFEVWAEADDDDDIPRDLEGLGSSSHGSLSESEDDEMGWQPPFRPSPEPLRSQPNSPAESMSGSEYDNEEDVLANDDDGNTPLPQMQQLPDLHSFYDSESDTDGNSSYTSENEGWRTPPPQAAGAHVPTNAHKVRGAESINPPALIDHYDSSDEEEEAIRLEAAFTTFSSMHGRGDSPDP
jgi:hypothetical protein